MVKNTKTEAKKETPVIPEITKEMVDKACYVLILAMINNDSPTMTVTQTNFQDYEGNLLGDFVIQAKRTVKRKSGIIIPGR